MTPPKTTIAAQLSKQLSSANVADTHATPSVAAPQLTLTSGTSEPTKFRLQFIENETPYSIDLSTLSQFRNIGKPFFVGYEISCEHTRRPTKVIRARDLQRYFFRFLKDLSLYDLELSNLDRQLFSRFIAWLDRPRAVEGSSPLAHGTRRAALGAVRGTLAGLAKHPNFAPEAAKALAAIPKRPWPGAHLKATPIARLGRDDLLKIIRAAEAEIGLTRLRIAERDRMIAAADTAPGTSPDFRNLATCLKTLNQNFPGVMPRHDELLAFNRSLAWAIQTRFSYTRILDYFYTTPRQLIPFVVLISAYTAFNVETVLTLKWSDIQFDNIFGQPVVRITGAKHRSDNPTVLLEDSDDELGIVSVLNLLRDHTKRIRPHVGTPRDADRIFIYGQLHGTGCPKAPRHSSGSASGDSSMRWARLNFISDHSLPHFTFDQFRTTILDEAHLITDDLMTVKTLARHRSLDTGWRHYTSSGTKARYRERLGQTLLLRERWHRSGGKIDPRNTFLTPTMDRGAATPGFGCFDPFDSPLPSQRKGRLCAAYGECPSCEMAAANISDSTSAALYLSLRDAIYRAQATLAPQSWSRRWAPVLQALDGLIGHIPREVRAQADNLIINLPAVG